MRTNKNTRDASCSVENEASPNRFPFPVLNSQMIFAVCACAGALLLAGCSASDTASKSVSYTGSEPFQPVVNPGNKATYEASGAFAAPKAKQAYYDMMRAFHYPLPKRLETDEFWVCDFLQHDFAKLGMGGIFWINAKGSYAQTGAKAYSGQYKDASYGYLGHDIYLLPGQMLPEHRHIGGNEGYGPKMEGWHVRHGTVEFFGEYKGGDEKAISEMPAAERPWGFGENWFKSKFVVKREAGQTYQLNDPESWHGQRAGPQGAIVTEYATYHNQVEFSKPGMLFKSSEAAK